MYSIVPYIVWNDVFDFVNYRLNTAHTLYEFILLYLYSIVPCIVRIQLTLYVIGWVRFIHCMNSFNCICTVAFRTLYEFIWLCTLLVDYGSYIVWVHLIVFVQYRSNTLFEFIRLCTLSVFYGSYIVWIHLIVFVSFRTWIHLIAFLQYRSIHCMSIFICLCTLSVDYGSYIVWIHFIVFAQ